jgi:CDP-glycerol glycerophosphotransferase
MSSGRQDFQGMSTPLISIIIPTFNVEAYLPDCLASITQQCFRGIEIIAVDGASEDATIKILEEAAGQEPRLTVYYLGKVGPGIARNEGVRHARGEYIWFVDGDDLISAGALDLIAGRIKAARPDVLFIDYQASYPNGKIEPGDGHDLMGRETPEYFTLPEQPWVIDLNMVSWTKIIRTEFYLSIGVDFWPNPPHEDIQVSCTLLMEASRLSLLNQACYTYKKYRPGSAMGTGSLKRHFNIFRPYEVVLKQAAEKVSAGDQRVTEEVWHAFFQRAVWHYTTIFDAGGIGGEPFRSSRLVAPQDRRDFFLRMHQYYVDFAPPGYRRPPGLRGIKFGLIEKNYYWTYCVLGPVNKLRVTMSRRIRSARRKPL